MRSLYDVLGVPRDADQARIRKAFHKLARKYHPDVSKEADAEKRFKEVGAAYEVLSDEQKRAWYDEFGEESLRVGFDAERARQWKSFGGHGPDPGGSPFGGAGGVDFDDFLSSILGGGLGGRGQGRGPERGADMEASAEVDLMEAIRGGDVLLSARRPGACPTCAGEGGVGHATCPGCQGSGRQTRSMMGRSMAIPCSQCDGSGTLFTRECDNCAGSGRVMTDQRLKVHIPAGVRHGRLIRLRGQGGEGKRGGPPGDLLMTINLRPHPFLLMRGDDLEMEVPITVSEALAGGTITVPTLDGEVKVKIPQGGNNGRRMRIKQRGMPRADGGRGHLFIVLRPVVPESADSEVLELAKKLDEAYTRNVREALHL